MNKRILAVLLLAMILCCTINIHAEGENTQEKPFSEIVQESKEISTDTMQKSEELSTESAQESEEASTEPTQVTEEPTSEPMREESSSESMEKPKETLQDITDSEAALLRQEVMPEEPEPIYNVSFPAKTKAYLDPGDVSGEGQIFSEHYKVENYGNTDISIKIKNISIRCLSDQDIYSFTEEDVIDPRSTIKKLHIDMVWEDGNGQEKVLHISEGARDEVVLFLKAASYDENGNFISLMEGGGGSFYFTGAVNRNPGLQWEDGEIVITFSYEITDAEAEVG